MSAVSTNYRQLADKYHSGRLPIIPSQIEPGMMVSFAAYNLEPHKVLTVEEIVFTTKTKRGKPGLRIRLEWSNGTIWKCEHLLTSKKPYYLCPA